MKKTNCPPVLIDLDGVLRLGKSAAPGLGEFLKFLERNSIKAAIISNTTQSSAKSLRKFFDEKGVQLNLPMLTAADATAGYIKTRFKKAAVFAMPEILELFEDVLDIQNPEVVVMGDLGKEWSFEKLNAIFKFAHNNVPIVAMQKNKFWKTPEDGLLLDLGAFVKAIEYAADVESLLIGKPSPLYFEQGLNVMGVAKGEEFIMIGDDLTNDIYPVSELNGKGILIYTGKTSYPLPADTKRLPDFEAMNLIEAIEILKTYL